MIYATGMLICFPRLVYIMSAYLCKKGNICEAVMQWTVQVQILR